MRKILLLFRYKGKGYKGMRYKSMGYRGIGDRGIRHTNPIPLYLYTIYLFFVLLISCEKRTDWQLQSENKNLIIVDGTITNQRKTDTNTIKLSFPVTQLNETQKPVTGAIVNISDEDSTYHLIEHPANSGIYKKKFIAYPGKHYTLLINYNNKIYSAQADMLSGINFQPLLYAKNTNNKLYHITKVVNNVYNPQNFAMWEILLDWSKVAGYQNQNPDSCKARVLYYTLPTIDVSQVLAPELEKISFPAGTIITERRYSLTKEHAEYIRALLSETNWDGGLFDSAHGNLPTNLSEGAAGFFAACGVTTLSITVTP
jgi:hypothetical protein